MRKYPETADEIEILDEDGSPDGAIACRMDYPDEDEAWMYDSA